MLETASSIRNANRPLHSVELNRELVPGQISVPARMYSWVWWKEDLRLPSLWKDYRTNILSANKEYLSVLKYHSPTAGFPERSIPTTSKFVISRASFTCKKETKGGNAG